MTIKIDITPDVTLTAPYHPDLPRKAHAAGGRFINGVWRFDPRDEARVRQITCAIFGTDGTPGPTATVWVPLADFATHLRSQRGPEALWLLGRRLVTRRGRDDRVELGPGVVVLTGGFPGSGGSVKNPTLDPEPDTMLEVRDVPAAHPHIHEYRLLAVDEKTERSALVAERAALVTRLAEIDELLADPVEVRP
ncbi:MAG: hypothetical protein ACRDTZ_09090 [Pseudonocardiaceae bacterium]